MSTTTTPELVTLRMSPTTRATILAALDEAAAGKRDLAAECDDGQEVRAAREAAAAEYDETAAIIREAHAGELELEAG
jgi:hypothetical protein